MTIIAIILFLLCTIYFSHTIPEMINSENKDSWFIPNWLMLICGLSFFVCIIISMVYILEFDEMKKQLNKNKKPNEYQEVHETFYRKIK